MTVNTVDVVLVGAGVMSATLGVLLKKLDPKLKITMVERLDDVAQESSYGWNNAGTGHAAYCELNYTPEDSKGEIDVKRALEINEQFEITLQLWAHLVQSGALPKPGSFINRTSHESFVQGEKDVSFLRRRYEAMKQHVAFEEMEYTEDPQLIREWMPLVIASRDPRQKIAATRVLFGSDVDFGALTGYMVKYLQSLEGFELLSRHNVKDITRYEDGTWKVLSKNRANRRKVKIKSRFVFLGAGGMALKLLQKSGIPEAKGYGGFPVSGQWLVCEDEKIVAQHDAKVYGKAPIGAPPMSVPHLDRRIINNKPALLFGPFAGFTTKFLKKGSIFDLPASVKSSNLMPMIQVGAGNLDLTKYLMKEAVQSHKSRVAALKRYYPEASEEDWKLAVAGQRVQIIKDCGEKGGKLEFGTEVISSSDGTLSALLGASPGASIAVSAMLKVIEMCFKSSIKSDAWQATLKSIIPSYGIDLNKHSDMLRAIRSHNLHVLGLR